LICYIMGTMIIYRRYHPCFFNDIHFAFLWVYFPFCKYFYRIHWCISSISLVIYLAQKQIRNERWFLPLEGWYYILHTISHILFLVVAIELSVVLNVVVVHLHILLFQTYLFSAMILPIIFLKIGTYSICGFQFWNPQ